MFLNNDVIIYFINYNDGVYIEYLARIYINTLIIKLFNNSYNVFFLKLIFNPQYNFIVSLVLLS